MMDFSSKAVCIVDNGNFSEFAVRLAKDFGTVYYWSPWQNAFPTSTQLLVGQNIPGVTRVESIWSIVNKTDLFVFPDLYHADLQEYLISLGKRVWGARRGEELELQRSLLKDTLKELGLPVMKYAVVDGMSNLREYLAKHENQFVKISKTRGDRETFCSINAQLVEPVLDDLEVTLGARKEHMEFIVEEAVTDAVEVGCDIYSIDGQYPATALCGIEIKDCGYLGHARPYDTVATPFEEVNAAFSRVLQKYDYRSFWCPEMRVKENGLPFVMDPCCRAGSPPSELQLLMMVNLAEVLWFGAEGQMVDWQPAGEWGAELMLESSWAEEHWQPIEFPEHLRDNIKLKFLTRLDDQYYVVPVGHKLPIIGAIVTVGSTPEDAIKKALDIAGQVKGPGISANESAVAEATKEVEKFKSFGFDL